MAQTKPTRPITRLGQILEEEGRKQTWLAERAGVTSAAISLYVNGLHCPDDKRELIAEALGRTVADVFPAPETAVAS